MLIIGGSIQPFFVFPTGSAYHGVCCAAEVVDLASAQQQHRIKKLMADLSRAPRGTGVAGGSAAAAQGSETAKLALQRDFMAEVAGEDPRNGEVTVKMVDLPFILEADAEQEAMWAI